MSAVGILGGTFDPIHYGHLITAQVVKEIRKLEKIILVPCHISPHKKDVKNLANNHRLEMIKSAIQELKGFEVSDFELKNGGISYTIETLKYFKKIYPKLELIIGFDNLVKFDMWKEPDRILEIAKLIVMKRKIDEAPKKKNKYFEKAILVDTPSIEINATQIRQRVKNDLMIDFLVPVKVKEYIYNFNLYK
ncbi:MAG TPA: nicotinate-nucleotide adenylyltransferase [Ignavibacteriaceae bacterium]|nr:nicotinate-nucleotide adenylyltransferase [Ignavibacteriaceae bacterium]